jgi:hypothetical protein
MRSVWLKVAGTVHDAASGDVCDNHAIV